MRLPDRRVARSFSRSGTCHLSAQSDYSAMVWRFEPSLMPESRCRLTSRCYDREICQGCCIDGQMCLSTDREKYKRMPRCANKLL